MAAQDLVTHLLDSADPDAIDPQAYLDRVPSKWVVFLSDPVWREDIKTRRDLMDYLAIQGYFVDEFEQAQLFPSKEAAEQALRDYLLRRGEPDLYPENFYGVLEVSHFLNEAVNPEACRNCGGRCCKQYPGITSPEDWGAPDTDQMLQRLSAAFKEDTYEVDNWYGDPRGGAEQLDQVSMVRPTARRGLTALVEPCQMLGAQGCSLPHEQRPKQCRELSPITVAGKHSCVDNYSKKQAALDWIPYQDVVKAAFRTMWQESADPDDIDPQRYVDEVPHKWAVVYEDPVTVRQYLKAFTDEWSIGGRDATLFPSKEQADFALKRYISNYHAEERPDTVEYYGVREMTDLLGESADPDDIDPQAYLAGVRVPIPVGAEFVLSCEEAPSVGVDAREFLETRSKKWLRSLMDFEKGGGQSVGVSFGYSSRDLASMSKLRLPEEFYAYIKRHACGGMLAIDRDALERWWAERSVRESADPDDIDPQRYVDQVPAGYIISWTNEAGVEWVYQNYNSFAGGSGARVNALVFPTHEAAQALLTARGLEGYDILPYTRRARGVRESADPDDPQALLNRMRGRWAVTTSVAGRPYYVKVVTLTDRQRAKRVQIGKPDYRWLYDWVLDIKRASLFTSKDAAEAVLNRMQSANETAGKYRSVQDVSGLLRESVDPDDIADPMDYMRKATIPTLVVSPYGLRQLLKANGYQVISVYRTKQYDGLNATVWMREHSDRDMELAEQHARFTVQRWVREQFGSELPKGTYVLTHSDEVKGTMSINIVYKGVNEAADPDDIADPHRYIAGAVEPLEQITTKEIRLLLRSMGFKVVYARKTKKFPGISLFVQDQTGRSLDWQDEKLVSNAIHEWMKKRLGNKPGTIRGYEYAHDYQINVWAWDGMETDVATSVPRRVRKPGLSIDIYKPAEGQSLYATHYLESADPDDINPQHYLDAAVKHHPVGAAVTSKRLDARYGKDKFLGQIKNMTSLGHPGHKFFNNLPAYYVEWHDYPSFNGSYPHDDLVVYYDPVGAGDYELGYEDDNYPDPNLDIDESADPDDVNPQHYLSKAVPSLEHLMEVRGYKNLVADSDRYYKAFPLQDYRWFVVSVEDNGMQAKSSEPGALEIQTYLVQARTRARHPASYVNAPWEELAFAQADDASLGGLLDFAEKMGKKFSRMPASLTDSAMQKVFIRADWDWEVKLGESLDDPDDPDSFFRRNEGFRPVHQEGSHIIKWVSFHNPVVIYSEDYKGRTHFSISDSGPSAHASVAQVKEGLAFVIQKRGLQRVSFTVFNVDRDIDAIYGLEADGVIETTGQDGALVFALVEEPGAVTESAEPVMEMGGAVNIWLSPAGKPYYCADHAEWAASEVLKKPLSEMSGANWEARGFVYRQMFRRGWVRLAMPHDQKKLMVDSRRTTPAQWEWIYDKGWEERLQVVDDQEQTIIDYREGSGMQPPKGPEMGTWESLQVSDPDDFDPDRYMRRTLFPSDALAELGFKREMSKRIDDGAIEYWIRYLPDGTALSVVVYPDASVNYRHVKNSTASAGKRFNPNRAFQVMDMHVGDFGSIRQKLLDFPLHESADPDDPDQFIERMPVLCYIVRGRAEPHHDWLYVSKDWTLSVDSRSATHYTMSAAQRMVDRYKSHVGGNMEIVPVQESVDPDAPERYVQSAGSDFGAWLVIQGLKKVSDSVVDEYQTEGFMEGAPRSLRVIHFRDGVDYRSNPRGPWLWCLLGTNKQGEGEEAEIRPVVERFLQRLRPTDDYTGEEDMPVEEAMVEVLLSEAGPDEFDPELYLHQTTSAREALRMVGMSSIGKAWPKDTLTRVFKRYPLNPPVPYNRGSVKEPNMTMMEAVTVYDFAGRATVRGGIEMAAGILFSDGGHSPQVSMDIDPENMTAGLARVIHHLDKFFASYRTNGKDWETVLRDVVRELGAARHAQHGRRMREAIEPFEQPDEITCGSSVVYMLSRSLGKLNADFQQVCQMCRTNRLWGTLPMFMSSALRKLGIAHTKTKVTAAAQLDGIYALLTVYEHLPHWILVTGQLDGQFTVNDPAQGAVVYNAETIDALLDKSQLSGVYRMVGFMIGTAFRIECPVQESADPDEFDEQRYAFHTMVHSKVGADERVANRAEAERRAIEDYDKALGRLFRVNYIVGYSGSDSVEIEGPMLVRVVDTDIEDDVVRWDANRYLDPIWQVEVISTFGDEEVQKRLEGVRNTWAHGKTYSVVNWVRESTDPDAFDPKRELLKLGQLCTKCGGKTASSGFYRWDQPGIGTMQAYRCKACNWTFAAPVPEGNSNVPVARHAGGEVAESADPDDPDAFLKNYHPMELIVKGQKRDGPRFITLHAWDNTFQTKASVERWLRDAAGRGDDITNYMVLPNRVVLEEWVASSAIEDVYLERAWQWIDNEFVDITARYPCPRCGGEAEPVDSDMPHFRRCTRCESTWYLGRPTRFGMHESVDPDEPTPENIHRLGRPGECSEPCRICGRFCTLNHYQTRNGVMMPNYHICIHCDMSNMVTPTGANLARQRHEED